MDKKTPSKNLPEAVRKSDKYSETSNEFLAENPDKENSEKEKEHGADSANNANNAKYTPNYNK
jgi:hypothetical protein